MTDGVPAAELLAGLRHPDWAVRYWAARVLRPFLRGHPDVAAGLLEATADPDAAVRVQAGRTLLAGGADRPVVLALVGRILAAGRSLCRARPETPEAALARPDETVPALLAACREDEEFAPEVLLGLDAPVFDPVVRFLRDLPEDDPAWEHAVPHLAKADRTADLAILAGAAGGRLRREAVGALGLLAFDVPAALRVLAELAADPDPSIRCAVAHALRHARDPLAAELLAGLREDEDPDVARVAREIMAAALDVDPESGVLVIASEDRLLGDLRRALRRYRATRIVHDREARGRRLAQVRAYGFLPAASELAAGWRRAAAKLSRARLEAVAGELPDLAQHLFTPILGARPLADLLEMPD